MWPRRTISRAMTACRRSIGVLPSMRLATRKNIRLDAGLVEAIEQQRRGRRIRAVVEREQDQPVRGGAGEDHPVLVGGAETALDRGERRPSSTITNASGEGSSTTGFCAIGTRSGVCFGKLACDRRQRRSALGRLSDR